MLDNGSMGSFQSDRIPLLLCDLVPSLLFIWVLIASFRLCRSLKDNHYPFYAELEDEMLEKVNKLGIGPQGFGGKTTAIGLNIETMPTHIAGMPCAVNINCHVTRHKTEVI